MEIVLWQRDVARLQMAIALTLKDVAQKRTEIVLMPKVVVRLLMAIVLTLKEVKL